MFFGGGSGVGLTVADPAPLTPEVGPPVTGSPPLAEMLPVRARTPEEKAAELQRVRELESALAAYTLELVAAFAAERPASVDRRPGEPGAAADPGDSVGAPDGVSEFFAEELALTLNCARASATTLPEHALTLTGPLRATRGELTQGRLDRPRARTFAEEPGWRVRDIDPAVIAEVEAAVLPEAAGLSIHRLKARLRQELAARDAAASDRRREQAHRAVASRAGRWVTGPASWSPGCPTSWPRPVRPRSTSWPGGRRRPVTSGRSGCCGGVLADLVVRPWPVPEPVAAVIEVQVPLGALTPEPFLASGAPVPPGRLRG